MTSTQSHPRRIIAATGAVIIATVAPLIAASPQSMADDGIPSDYPMQPFAHAGAAANDSSPSPRASSAVRKGGLIQLSGKAGCLTDKSVHGTSCGKVRALKGPGPFMGSNAIAISKDGRFVYAASSKSNAIAVFARDRKTGELTQAKGRNGCISDNGKNNCHSAVGLQGPNSLAISSDGKSVYATSRDSNSITAFRRNANNGSLTQVGGAPGCIAGSLINGCASGVGLKAPDVVVVSRDGRNVYLGSFLGNTVAAFSRDQGTGGLTQLAGTNACIGSDSSCAPGTELNAPEGMAINNDGTAVYVATAVSNAVVTLTRNSDGSLSQAGCITTAPQTGCTTGRELAGVNALALTKDGRYLYSTSLFSGSLIGFTGAATGSLTLPPTLGACTAFLGDARCQYGRDMDQPEGVTVAPDGKTIYVAAFRSNAIDVFKRNTRDGSFTQQAGTSGCIAVKSSSCASGRALKGVSSIVVSPDNRFVYSTSFRSNAVNVFRRVR